jgi:hypothetical protein
VQQSSYTLVQEAEYPGGFLIESIIAEIDVEISRLQQARAILAATELSPKLVRLAKTVTIEPAKRASPKRRVMSDETKEKMRQGQLKRWATAKKSATPTKLSGCNKVPKQGSQSRELSPTMDRRRPAIRRVVPGQYASTDFLRAPLALGRDWLWEPKGPCCRIS